MDNVVKLAKRQNGFYILPGEKTSTPTPRNLYGRVCYDIHDILGTRVFRCWTHNVNNWKLTSSMGVSYSIEVSRLFCRNAIGEWLAGDNTLPASVVEFACNPLSRKDYITWLYDNFDVLDNYVKSNKHATLDHMFHHTFTPPKTETMSQRDALKASLL